MARLDSLPSSGRTKSPSGQKLNKLFAKSCGFLIKKSVLQYIQDVWWIGPFYVKASANKMLAFFTSNSQTARFFQSSAELPRRGSKSLAWNFTMSLSSRMFTYGRSIAKKTRCWSTSGRRRRRESRPRELFYKVSSVTGHQHMCLKPTRNVLLWLHWCFFNLTRALPINPNIKTRRLPYDLLAIIKNTTSE